ncbi:PREDICTED: uncharacterized protein LOC109127240 [Camelina sativa]|uniref:Uncharacterized protein LOC109127240 n=1 Tax=Camelina sativa TaxID=90675 RepID=A0ABM1QKP0_CAMSA|nr:PREDICTED: uncharacterized protein LOC109127240 [Camelina sativa]
MKNLNPPFHLAFSRPKLPIFNIQSSKSSNLKDLLVNLSFENPNKMIKVRFQSSSTLLLFNNNLVDWQFIYPFNLSTHETKFGFVRFASDFRSLHENDKMDLQKQLQNNKLEFQILTIFRVRATLGSLHYSIMLLGRCELQLTSPPNGLLLIHHCTTKKTKKKN